MVVVFGALTVAALGVAQFFAIHIRHLSSASPEANKDRARYTISFEGHSPFRQACLALILKGVSQVIKAQLAVSRNEETYADSELACWIKRIAATWIIVREGVDQASCGDQNIRKDLLFDIGDCRSDDAWLAAN